MRKLHYPECQWDEVCVGPWLDGATVSRAPGCVCGGVCVPQPLPWAGWERGSLACSGGEWLAAPSLRDRGRVVLWGWMGHFLGVAGRLPAGSVRYPAPAAAVNIGGGVELELLRAGGGTELFSGWSSLCFPFFGVGATIVGALGTRILTCEVQRGLGKFAVSVLTAISHPTE